MTDERSTEATAAATRSGFVALIGAPNVGKSTLVNALVGSKVTIVSRKVQTTRAPPDPRHRDREQRADHSGRHARYLLAEAAAGPRHGIDGVERGPMTADVVCVLLDAKVGIDDEADAILTKVGGVDHEKILVLNKIDLVPREKAVGAGRRRPTIGWLSQGRSWFSALSGDGVDDLRRTLGEMVPTGPFLYPEDQMSDAPMRHLAAEITREKIYQKLHQELPYQSTVENRHLDRAQGQVRSHRADHLRRGAKASARSCSARMARPLSRSARASRHEISEILDVPVHLFLFVKVRENWGDDPDRYREMGLEFPRE